MGLGLGSDNIWVSNILQSGTVPHYALSYSKLFVWNMTQYETLLWLDSDTLVAASLDLVFNKAERLSFTVYCQAISGLNDSKVP